MIGLRRAASIEWSRTTGEIARNAASLRRDKQKPHGDGSIAMTETEQKALEALLHLAQTAWSLADGSEDLGDGYHKSSHEDFTTLCEALDALDELPDDRPGYVMGPAAKARWALRALAIHTDSIRAEERERCARMADEVAVEDPGPWRASAGKVAARIRSLSPREGE